MKTKLTLTVESDVIESVKQLARRKGTSVSSLFEQWTMRMVAHEQKTSHMESLEGLWSHGTDEEMNLDQSRLEALLEKFGS